MANQSPGGDLDSGASAGRWVVCEIPECMNRMPYSGRGAPPKYCGQMVEGLKHTRLTAHRLSKGQITMPAPGSSFALAPADSGPGGEADGDQARPVTAARLTLELLLAEVREQVAGHEQRTAVLAEQITHAVQTVADPDAAAAEVSAAHRAARRDIDAAEAERDQALVHAREARRAAEQSAERTTVAESAAEEALTELERAEEARDHSLSQLHELTATAAGLRDELSTAQTRTDQLGELLATARHEAAELVAAQTELTAQLATEREAVQRQARRAELAEQHGERAAGQIEQLVTELTLARQQVERWQEHAAEHRADLAAARSELTAAMAALDAERTHATQRLADQRDRYDELISELRTQLHEIGHQRPRANRRQEDR